MKFIVTERDSEARFFFMRFFNIDLTKATITTKNGKVFRAEEGRG